MSSTKQVFLIGPGFIGREIIDRLLAEGYTVTTLVRRESAAKDLNAAGIKTILGDLASSDIITSQVEQSDIVIHSATADDLPSVKAVIAGIERRGDKPTYYIHTSGTGVLADQSKGAFKSEDVYSDDDPDKINTISDDAPHRKIDLAILEARKRLTNAKIAIILPPLIYGLNPRYNRTSIQLPTLVRFALKHGYAGHVGDGLSMWNQVHVADVAQAYIVVLHWLETATAQEIAKNPYFFADNGEEFAWRDAVASIGKILHAAGKLQSAVPKTIPEKDYADVLGPGVTELVVGSNARSRATRLRTLGWTTQGKSMYQSLEEDEIPFILQEKST